MPYRRYRPGDPRRYVTQMQGTLGRRGTALVLLGVAWIGIGMMILTAPAEQSFLILPDRLWLRPFEGLAWIVTGVVAIASAPRDRTRNGWTALYLMPVVRTCFFTFDFLLWLAPLGDIGEGLAIFAAVPWVFVTGLLYLLSGWAEPVNEALASEEVS